MSLHCHTKKVRDTLRLTSFCRVIGYSLIFFYMFIIFYLNNDDTAPCGTSGTLDATDANQILSSPNYPAAPGVNLRCRWLIDGNSTAVKIHFQHLSIGSPDSAQCTNDRLEVQDVISVIIVLTKKWLCLYQMERLISYRADKLKRKTTT